MAITQRMLSAARVASCPLAVHVEYVARSIQGDFRGKRKFAVNDLSSKDEYKAWRYKISMGLFAAGLLDFVTELIKNGKCLERTLPADCFGPLTYHQQGQPFGQNGTLTERQVVDFVGVGSAVQAALKGKAIEYVMESGCKNIVEVLTVLDENWGQVTSVDRYALQQEFWGIKWNPNKISLSDWILQKHSIGTRIPDLMPPGDILTSNMLQVMLNSMPERFAGICSDVRSKPPSDWKDVQKKLIDFDKAWQYQKSEPSGTTLRATTDNEANVHWAKGKGKGKGG